MPKHPDLLQDKIRPLYWHYLLPSVGGTIVTSIYILVDTIMIGKGIGPLAVAALNIILPLYAFLYGAGFLFGVGGAVLLAVARGRGETKEANGFFSTAILLNLATTVIYMALVAIFFEKIIAFLGATPLTATLIREYAWVFWLGTPCFMFSAFLQPFIRNDAGVRLVMVGVVSGGVLNIFLDYLFIFVFQGGMAGAALATVLGTGFTLLVLTSHFWRRHNTLRLIWSALSLRKAKAIFVNGLSAFLIETSAGLIIFAFNWQLLRYTGETGVAVYGIIANTAIMVGSVANGIAQGAQPIISHNFGAQQSQRIKAIYRLGLLTAFVTGASFCLFGLFFPTQVVQIFLVPTPEIAGLARPAILIYFFAFIPMAANIFLGGFFQAILRPRIALLIILLRGFALSLGFVFILPHWLNVAGIWLAMPLAETATLVIALWLKKATQRHEAGAD
jgi:putative MATE family efflux protein